MNIQQQVFRLAIAKFKQAKQREAENQKDDADLSNDSRRKVNNDNPVTEQKQFDSFWKDVNTSLKHSVAAAENKEKAKEKLTANEPIKEFLKQSDRLIIYPDSNMYKIVWDLFMAFFVLYTIVAVPYRIGFDVVASDEETSFEIFITICFAMDILVSFFTAYFDEEADKWIIDKTAIAKNYLTFWFWLDILVTIPFDQIIGVFMENNRFGAVRIIRLFRLVRLVKIQRILQQNDIFEMLFHPLVYNMLLVLARMFLIAHILACFWHFITLPSDLTGVHFPNSWVQVYGFDEQSVRERYVASLYFIFVTMMSIGYGDICPQNELERFYAILVMLIGTIVFGGLVAQVTQLVHDRDPYQRKQNEQLRSVKEHLEPLQISYMSKDRTRNAYAYYMKHKTFLSEYDALDTLLPPSYLVKHVYKVYASDIHSIAFLRGLSDPIVVVHFLKYLRPFELHANDILYEEFDILQDIVFVKKGLFSLKLSTEKIRKVIQATHEKKTNNVMAEEHSPTTTPRSAPFSLEGVQYVGYVQHGHMFGDIEHHCKLSTSLVQYTALKHTQCFAISFPKFDQVIKENKTIHNRFATYASTRCHSLQKVLKLIDTTTQSSSVPLENEINIWLNGQIIHTREELHAEGILQQYMPPTSRSVRRRSVRTVSHDTGITSEKQLDIEEDSDDEADEDGIQVHSSFRKKIHIITNYWSLPRKTRIISYWEHLFTCSSWRNWCHNPWRGRKRNNYHSQTIIPDNMEEDEVISEKRQENNPSLPRGKSAANLKKQQSMASILSENQSLPDIKEITVASLATDYYFILPTHRYKVYWDVFIGILIFFSILVAPVQIGFNTNAYQDNSLTPYIVDALFFLDILANFRTVIEMKEHDAWIVDSRKIASEYCQGWFIIDFVSSIPFDAFGSDTGGSVSLVKVLRLLRLTRLIRLFKFGSWLEQLERYSGVSSAAFELLSLMLQLFFIAHLVACFWWGITSSMASHPWFSYTGGNQTTHTLDGFAFGRLQGNDINPGAQYLMSIYFIITTMTTVGYGDVHPMLMGERIVAIFIIVFGASIFGYMIASIGSILSTISSSNDVTEIQERVNEIMKAIEIKNCYSSEEMTGISKYIQAHLKDTAIEKQSSAKEIRRIAHRIPAMLGKTLLTAYYESTMKKIVLLNYIPHPSIAFFIYDLLTPQYYEPNAYICRENDGLMDGLFFLVSGRAKAFCRLPQQQQLQFEGMSSSKSMIDDRWRSESDDGSSQKGGNAIFPITHSSTSYRHDQSNQGVLRSESNDQPIPYEEEEVNMNHPIQHSIEIPSIPEEGDVNNLLSHFWDPKTSAYSSSSKQRTKRFKHLHRHTHHQAWMKLNDPVWDDETLCMDDLQEEEYNDFGYHYIGTFLPGDFTGHIPDLSMIDLLKSTINTAAIAPEPTPSYPASTINTTTISSYNIRAMEECTGYFLTRVDLIRLIGQEPLIRTVMLHAIAEMMIAQAKRRHKVWNPLPTK